MKRYVFEVRTLLTIKADSEDAARDHLDFILGNNRRDVPQLVNVLDLSDTGIDNRRIDSEHD